VRALFVTLLVLLVLGLAYFIVLGLVHR
jgi:hypothetical protein